MVVGSPSVSWLRYAMGRSFAMGCNPTASQGSAIRRQAAAKRAQARKPGVWNDVLDAIFHFPLKEVVPPFFRPFRAWLDIGNRLPRAASAGRTCPGLLSFAPSGRWLVGDSPTVAARVAGGQISDADGHDQNVGLALGDCLSPRRGGGWWAIHPWWLHALREGRFRMPTVMIRRADLPWAIVFRPVGAVVGGRFTHGGCTLCGRVDFGSRISEAAVQRMVISTAWSRRSSCKGIVFPARTWPSRDSCPAPGRPAASRVRVRWYCVCR